MKGQGAESSVCRGSVLRWLQDGISWCQNQQSITKCCSCDGSRSSKSDPFRRGANDVNAKHRPSLLLRSGAREQPRPLRRPTTPAHACTQRGIDTHGVIHWTRPLRWPTPAPLLASYPGCMALLQGEPEAPVCSAPLTNADTDILCSNKNLPSPP